ncbi:MAG: DUF1501 domain-containing protein [Planctomycetales bacterium]|nr:DUF1501 domain-containing protein [Planctomycetales bacterium]MCA9168408.1 DUF1501 domain-containing protein [Planctomycetales bacterium]
MLAKEATAVDGRKTPVDAPDPLAVRAPLTAPRAKRVIFLYMTGGVSHVDSFDYKPQLIAQHGQQIMVDNWQGKLGQFPRFLKRPNWKFRPGGQCGTMISDLFPHVRSVADELCVIRSLSSDHTNHYESTLGMHCGSWTFARPSIGAWVSYGLGTENRNLPSFVVIAPHAPYAGTQTWGSDFLPGAHQGTWLVPGAEPIANIRPRSKSLRLQQMELELINRANAQHQLGREEDQALAARIRSFETAFGMQHEAPEALDLSGETPATLRMYGLERGQTTGFGWQCLVARRLIERDVRFVELIDVGAANNWDAHGDMATHAPLAKNVDQAIAALIRDLKQRGLLDDTLVVWTTEFGRTPYHEKADHPGREHHHQVFSSWLAGGGVKAGISYGESDEYGIAVAENRVHVHDFHATILHLLGLDHERLTFRHAGRDYRLTDIHGEVVLPIVA